MLLNILVETLIHTIFLMNSKFKRTAFIWNRVAKGSNISGKFLDTFQKFLENSDIQIYSSVHFYSFILIGQ